MLRDLFSRKPAAAPAPITLAPPTPPAAEPAAAVVEPEPAASTEAAPGPKTNLSPEVIERAKTQQILDVYLHTPPSDQNAVDLFKGEWASIFPPPHGEIKAGGVPLFQDGRVAWAIDRLGGVRGQKVLELGPLEAGHSYMLEQAGAASVYAIESNTRAYLKCLVAKEVLGMTRTKFGCGDFMAYLDQTDEQYDTIVAAGVLYHMKDPLRALQLIGSHTRRAYIWTHYYDQKVITDSWYLVQRFDPKPESESLADGHTVELHRQIYNDSLGEQTYCGGGQNYSLWMTRDGLFDTLRHLGFTKFEIGYDEPLHPHGPSLALTAVKE